MPGGADIDGDPRVLFGRIDIGADEATIPKGPWTFLGHALGGDQHLALAREPVQLVGAEAVGVQVLAVREQEVQRAERAAPGGCGHRPADAIHLGRGHVAGQAVGVGPDQLVERRPLRAGQFGRRDALRLADLGGIPLQGSSADFGKLIAEEIEKWAKVIRATNIKAD